MTYTHHPHRQSTRSDYFGDITRYRHLGLNLVGADLRSRFRRSRLGLIWAIIQPLCFSLMIALVWGALFQQSFLNFAIYVFSGMVVWEYFSNVIFQSQDSLTTSEGYLKQGRIPLIIFQARSVLSGLVTFFAGLIGLVGLLAALQQLPELGWHLVLAPAIVPILLLFLMPIAIIFSILGTQYRDLRHAVSIAVSALFFLSPVMLERQYLTGDHIWFLKYANPLMPLLDMMRDPILYNRFWQTSDMVILCSWIVGLWILAYLISIKFGRKIIFAI